MNRFSDWFELTEKGVQAHGPQTAAALQVRRADGVLSYSEGMSAMVWYGYSSENAAKTLRKVFGEELKKPGSLGQGPLVFRYLQGASARASIARRADHFLRKFGEVPLFNQDI